MGVNENIIILPLGMMIFFELVFHPMIISRGENYMSKSQYKGRCVVCNSTKIVKFKGIITCKKCGYLWIKDITNHLRIFHQKNKDL